MDYTEFFEWYDFLKQNVNLLEQGLQEIEKGSPLRKMFKRNIKYQKRQLKGKVDYFVKKMPSTVRIFRRMGEEKANLLLKKLAKHHELCCLVSHKLVAIFPMAYARASEQQKRLWLEVMGCREVAAYLFEHSGELRDVCAAIQATKGDDETCLMGNRLLMMLMNYTGEEEAISEHRAELLTFSVE